MKKAFVSLYKSDVTLRDIFVTPRDIKLKKAFVSLYKFDVTLRDIKLRKAFVSLYKSDVTRRDIFRDIDTHRQTDRHTMTMTDKQAKANNDPIFGKSPCFPVSSIFVSKIVAE